MRTSREPGVSVQHSLWHRLAQRWVQCVHRHGADSSVCSEVELLLSKLAATGLQQAAPQVKVNTNNCSTPLKICIERENEELWKEYPAANTDTATTSTLQCSRALQTKGWTSKNTLRNALLSLSCLRLDFPDPCGFYPKSVTPPLTPLPLLFS